ncbi:MAG: hypothetical protein PHD58_11080 [Anaerolineales bacterium]|nr:hypothetical protein [Anaerolineales bacterium]
MSRRLAQFLPVLLFLALAACALPGSQGQVTDTALSSPQALPTSTSTPPLSETPNPPSIVLVATPSADPALAASLQERLASLAEEAELHFETRPALTPADLPGANLRVAVLLGADDALLTSLASAAPEVQFLAIGSSNLEPSPNLSLVSFQAQRADLQAFLAGYIAAAVTEDWRVGVVSEAGTPNGKAARNGFTNGVFFFCGLCRPVYPPFPIPGYPLTWELAAGGGGADWEAAMAYFKEWSVKTIYVADPLAEAPLLDAMAASGFNLIASPAPTAATQSVWIASVGSADLLQAVEALWPDLLAGKEGARLDLTLAITHANPALFSPGRQDYVAHMLADLQQGYIDTGVDPASGEMR